VEKVKGMLNDEAETKTRRVLVEILQRVDVEVYGGYIRAINALYLLQSDKQFLVRVAEQAHHRRLTVAEGNHIHSLRAVCPKETEQVV